MEQATSSSQEPPREPEGMTFLSPCPLCDTTASQSYFVLKAKERYGEQSAIYSEFLEILRSYRQNLKPIEQVYQEVRTLFLHPPAPDL